MNVTLQLRFSETPLRSAAAWLIPGGEPSGWLTELARWNVPLAEAGLCVIHAESGEAIGVVVVLPGNAKPTPTPLARPYGRIAGRLLLPVEAALDPPLADAEVVELLPAGDATFVWHPAAGLLRFDAEAALSVAELLTPPPAGDRNWGSAQPGIATNQRLLSIEPAQRPSIEEVLLAGRDDIGTQPMHGADLPRAPGEPVGGAIGRAIAGAGMAAAAGAAGMIAAAAQAVSAGLSGLTGGEAGAAASAAPQRRAAASGGSQGPNWIERLAQWARQKQQAMRQNIDQMRHSQIERLLSALQKSPDLGLRFALPLTSLGAARGHAPPGARLIERNINFNLNRLGGGGPVDVWDLPDDYRRKLALRYRELANREISLGRHRRAAYILAELLGDLTSAAATLAEGQHFREAAQLYETRLNQPLAAARCLQRGGLLTEAVALYERLSEWETVGELYEQLDQPDRAAEAFRRAVTRRISAFDHLGAAKLLETKLAVPDEALTTLLGGWNGSSQAERCLDEAFDLLARHQKNDRARSLIDELSTRPAKPVVLTGGLARLATKFPDAGVRETAASSARRLVSAHLPTAAPYESESLLRSLGSLVPADRLLERDCRRYREQQIEKDRRRIEQASRRQPRSKLPTPIRTFRLPPGEWKAAVGAGEEFYAAGIHAESLLVVRGRFDGAVQLPMGDVCKLTAEQAAAPVFLAADPRGLAFTYVHVPPDKPWRDLRFAATDKYQRAMQVSPIWGGEKPLEGLIYSSGGSLLLLTLPEPGIAQVTPYDPQLRLRGVVSLTYSIDALDSDDDIHRPLPFFARGDSLYLAIGSRLISKRGGQESSRLYSPIRSITGSPLHTRPRIVLACEDGGYVQWGESARSPATRFAQDMHQPVVGLTRGGWLAASVRGELEVHSTEGGRLSFIGRTSAPTEDPLAILPTGDTSRFALVTASGLVTVYEVPG